MSINNGLYLKGGKLVFNGTARAKTFTLKRQVIRRRRGDWTVTGNLTRGDSLYKLGLYLPGHTLELGGMTGPVGQENLMTTGDF